MLGKLFIISAPSGAGKTSLVNELLKRLEYTVSLKRVITYTSKQPRFNEIDGKDYHFISPQEFEKRIKRDFFLEYSTAYQTYYGSPKSIIKDMKKGISYILIIDRVGAKHVIKKVPQSVLIWIYTDSIKQLEWRLIKRATETPEMIKQRLTRAQHEIDEESREKLYHYHVLNDDFNMAVLRLENIVTSELETGL